ncbi:hypothetical protein TWF718_002820 [Orbilia javanica]|uniref:Uncharacterized protein n=1 Tax=Orbilia javanica TaxID=47235 RepID=A0AAN8MT25_9PEZI
MSNPPNSPVSPVNEKAKDDCQDEERPDDPQWPYSEKFLAALTPQELAKLHSRSPKPIDVESDDAPPQSSTVSPPHLIPYFDKRFANFSRPYQFKPEDWNPVLGRYTLVHPERSECWVPDGADTRDAIGVWRCPKLKESGERYFKTLRPLDRNKWWIWDPEKEYYFDGVFLKSHIHKSFSCQLEELGESVTDRRVYDRYAFL